MKHVLIMFVCTVFMLHGVEGRKSHIPSLRQLALRKFISSTYVYCRAAKDAHRLLFDIACWEYAKDGDLSRLMHCIILFRLPLEQSVIQAITQEAHHA